MIPGFPGWRNNSGVTDSSYIHFSNRVGQGNGFLGSRTAWVLLLLKPVVRTVPIDFSLITQEAYSLYWRFWIRYINSIFKCG